MKKTIFFTCALLVIIGLNAQNEGISGARSYGLAGNAILFQDVWSTNNNPAGLGELKSWNAGFSYENQFLLNELSNRTIIATLPVSQGSIGLSVNQFGFSNYNENRIGLSYGQQLGKKLSMGIQLNYLNVRLGGEYGSRSALSGNIGLLAKITKELSLAAVVVNPNRARLSDFTDERFPTLIKLGLGYQFSDKLQVISEVVKDIDFDSNLRVGIEYYAVKKLYFRAGYATTPSLTSFGFGVDLTHVKLDFASSFDSNFGFSPQISFSYKPKNN